MDLKTKIREIPDFPKKGISFKDITTLLLDSNALKFALEKMVSPFLDMGISKVVGIESRGFIFGMPIAREMNLGFIPIRKPGKLPGETLSQSYELEYGTDHIEIHTDAVQKGENILIVDDLLATGGTMEAAVGLIQRLGGRVAGISFLIELPFLQGRAKLGAIPVKSVVQYDK